MKITSGWFDNKNLVFNSDLCIFSSQVEESNSWFGEVIKNDSHASKEAGCYRRHGNTIFALGSSVYESSYFTYQQSLSLAWCKSGSTLIKICCT